MQFEGFLFLVGRYIRYGRSSAVGTPTVHFHKQDIDHGVEVGATDDGVLYGHYFAAEVFPELLDDGIVIGFFSVELVHGKNDGLLHLFGVAEDVLSPYFNAVLRIDDDNARIGNIHGRKSTADKIVGSRAVDDIQFLV